MHKLKKITSKATVLPEIDIDTDQIIPARFLTTTSRVGLGKHLFHDWRYLDDGKENPKFTLNKDKHSKNEILIAGNNFGCGSSREHAPWALTDYGFKVIISSKIADIFKSNALKNGLLPIVVDKKTLRELVANSDKKITVCVVSSEITLPNKQRIKYEIDEFSKFCLIEGIDQLEFIQRNINKIKDYECSKKWTP